MPRYLADVRFIASIYPGELPVIRRNYGTTLESEGRSASRSTAFRLEPVPRGDSPFVLAVYDSFEEVLDVTGMSSMGGSPQNKRAQKPVRVEEIVADLLKQWTGGLHNVPQGASPGIIEIKPMKVEMEKFEKNGSLPGPGPKELSHMVEVQTAYFEYLFQEGEKYHQRNEWKEITNSMRLAADWLGYSRVWSHRAIARDSGPCPACTKIIPTAAAVCPECHTQIRALPAEIAALHLKTAAQLQAAK